MKDGRSRAPARLKAPRPSHAASSQAGAPLRFWTIGIVAAAILYQAGVLLRLSHSPYFGNPILDARYQIEWAFALAAGRDPHPVFFQSPLYSYLVAGFLRAFGWHVWGLVLLQWCCVLVTALLVRETLARLGVERRVALGALAFVLFYPLYPYYAAFLHKTTLEVLVHVLFLYLGVRMVAGGDGPRRELALAFAFGLACGLAALVRSTFQAFLLLPWALISGRRAVRIGLMVLGFLVPFGWATWHNTRGAGEWVPLQTSFGFNIFLGNNPWNAEGALIPAPGMAIKPLEEEASARAYAERQAGRPLRISQVNAVYVGLVRAYAQNSPGRFLSALAHKFYWYLHREELPDDDCYRCMADTTLLLSANPLHWGWLALLVPPALVLVVARWRWRRRVSRAELFALAYAFGLVAVTMVFFVSSRFRVSHVAAWLVVAALGLDVVVREWRSHRAAILMIAGLGICPGIALLAQPLPVYPPDDATMKLVFLYRDLDEFGRAEATALTLQNPELRTLELGRIAELRAAPDQPGRRRRLLGDVIPARKRDP